MVATSAAYAAAHPGEVKLGTIESWLIWKLDGEEQAHARKLAIRWGAATIVLMGAVSLYNLLR